MNKDVIIALDFPTLEDTMNFLEKFGEEKLFVKVGMELYLQNGPVVLEKIKSLGHKVFLEPQDSRHLEMMKTNALQRFETLSGR